MEIEAVFKDGNTKAYTQSVTQFDHKLTLHISGVLLPEKFEAHFANSNEGEIASVVKGENFRVRVPDVYLQKGEYVYVWIYANKVSMYELVIPVKRRSMIYQLNDGDDEKEKTYAFVMDDEDTLSITTVDEDEAPSQDGGWIMGEDETLEYRS